jgi:hypothetical protein
MAGIDFWKLCLRMARRLGGVGLWALFTGARFAVVEYIFVAV